RLFDAMSSSILPARTPGIRVAQQLDHYEGLTSQAPGPNVPISPVAPEAPAPPAAPAPAAPAPAPLP
ncbi:hypothetical protein, partial [Mycolicibacterium alvei]|uniref:hypothetical protein n=1 Tax=Mycolicibacterium alvei TaxID=67081 RepID=UPI0021F26215